MKTKKIAAVLLTCIMAIGLMAGCGASNTNQSASNNDSQSTSTNQSGNEEADTNSENTTDTTSLLLIQKIHQQEMEKHWLYIIQLQEIQKMLLKR